MNYVKMVSKQWNILIMFEHCFFFFTTPQNGLWLVNIRLPDIMVQPGKKHFV